MKFRGLGWLITLFSFAFLLPAQSQRPLLGAQVWIEPGQSPAEIDGWFRQLAEEHMPVARIFVMWSYLETARGQWDYTLYDSVFRAAEKHHVKIVATLTPSGPPPFLGGNGNQGGGYPPTRDARGQAATYIANIVDRYKSSPALDTWLLVNEPGIAPAMDPAALEEFRTWLPQHYPSIHTLNLSWGSAYESFAAADPKPPTGQFASENQQIDWLDFWRAYQTEQLAWIAQQVRQHDPDPAHGIHVNPHALISNLAGLSDDLPSWRPFLDTLGCSIHPAWHFGLLSRDQFALGVSYINDLVQGAVEPKPHWVTELQGGNNIYSSTRPMDPTPDDIAQWVWTSVGAGADRVIFWLLNARRQGTESAEWSLLDFQQRPSQRLETAADIAKIIDAHADFFAGAHPVESQITVILSPDTMTLEARYNDQDFPGRDRNAHLLELLGFYQALSQIGPPPHVKHIDDYDWRARSALPRIAILPDIRAITDSQVSNLEAFTANGNTLLITALTGFYDPHAKAWPLAGFPLARVTGGDLKEVHFIADKLSIPLTARSVTLPSHLWLGSIDNHSATILGSKDGEVIATERKTENGGGVIWIPSPVGMGAWLGDSRPLAAYLQNELAPATKSQVFRFSEPKKGCLIRVLKNQNTYVSVVTNGTDGALTCEVLHPTALHPTKLWGTEPVDSKSVATYALGPRGTAVTEWR